MVRYHHHSFFYCLYAQVKSMSISLYKRTMQIAAQIATDTKRCPFCGTILKFHVNDEGIGYWDVCSCKPAQIENEVEVDLANTDFDVDYPCDQEGYYPPPELRFSAEELSEDPRDQ